MDPVAIFAIKGIMRLWKRRLRKRWKQRALELVKLAAVQDADGQSRRRNVAYKLMQEFDMAESQARRCVEWAVNRWKVGR